MTTFLGYVDIRSITASGILFDTGVDKSISATLHYDGDKVGRFFTFTAARCPNVGEIIGTKGIIKIQSPFWAPTQLIIEDPQGNIVKNIEVPDGKDPKYGPYNFINSGHLHYEAEHVRMCLSKGLKESPNLPHAETIAIAEILEKCRKAAGVEYPADTE